MKFLLLLLLPACLTAQRIEIQRLRDAAPLEGTWKLKQGDDPRWASPDLDDSAWTDVRMPRNASLHPYEFFWLRVFVTLPEPLPEEPLFLLIGPQFPAYEVFVNGKKVGQFGGPLGKASGLYVTRPAIFPLPREARLSIAVRVHNGQLILGRPGYAASRTQSFIGTRADVDGLLARFDADRAGQTFLPKLLCLTLTLGGLVFLALYFARRSSPEYLWCGLLFLAAMGNRLAQFVPEVYGGSRLASVLSTFVTDSIFPVAWVMLPLSILRLRPGVPDWLLLIGWAGSSVQYLPQVSSTLDASGWDAMRLVRQLLLIGSYAGAVLRAGAARSTAERLWPIHAALGSFCLLNTSFFAAAALRGNLFGDEYGPWELVLRSPILLLIFAMGILLFQRSARQDQEEARMRQELAAAAQVQDLLLANEPVPGVDAVYLPSTEVGGDFYFVRKHEAGCLVVVGDVSGKGLRAAMLASVAIGALRREESASPAEVLSSLNRVLLQQTGGGFVTCCCARFNGAGSAVVATAGHPGPLVDGREAELAAGLPLGVLADSAYKETTVAGERFTFVSDGVVEAENDRRQLFGFDRTREISGRSAHEIAEAARAWGQNDDITVVTVRRTA